MYKVELGENSKTQKSYQILKLLKSWRHNLEYAEFETRDRLFDEGTGCAFFGYDY